MFRSARGRFLGVALRNRGSPESPSAKAEMIWCGAPYLHSFRFLLPSCRPASASHFHCHALYPHLGEHRESLSSLPLTHTRGRDLLRLKPARLSLVQLSPLRSYRAFVPSERIRLFCEGAGTPPCSRIRPISFCVLNSLYPPPISHPRPPSPHRLCTLRAITWRARSSWPGVECSASMADWDPFPDRWKLFLLNYFLSSIFCIF